MERVGILINKLQEQLAQRADFKSMLITTQMLQAELLKNGQNSNGRPGSKVSVVLPFSVASLPLPLEVPETIHHPSMEEGSGAHVVEKPFVVSTAVTAVREEAIVEAPSITVVVPDVKPEPVLTSRPLYEARPQLEEATAKQEVPVVEDVKAEKPKEPGWLFETKQAPTSAPREKVVYELNDTMLSETGSLNEKLKEEKAEVAHTISGSPIKDLKKAISINDRHRFIHDLFRDDETMYERSIKTINSFNIFPEAEYWIQRELKLKLGWDTSHETVKIFDQLIKRRFS